MKCLEKDRNRRYESATGLAKDVLCYLDGDTVEACPPTLGYRLRKSYRKNRTAVMTTGLVAVALILGTIVTSLQAVRAMRAERHAQEQLERAQARAFLDLCLEVTLDRLRLSAGAPGEGLAHGDLAPDAARPTETGAAEALDALLAARADVERNLAPQAVVDAGLLALASMKAVAAPHPR